MNKKHKFLKYLTLTFLHFKNTKHKININDINNKIISIIVFFERYWSLSSIALFIIPKSENVKGVPLKVSIILFAIPKIIQINDTILNANNLLLNKKHGLKVAATISELYRKILKECLNKL